MRENHFPPGTLSLVPRVSTASPSPSSTASFNPLVPLPPPIPIPAAAAVCGPPENRHSSPAPLRGCFPAVLFCTARKVASHLQSRPLHMLGRNVVRTWREREREERENPWILAMRLLSFREGVQIPGGFFWASGVSGDETGIRGPRFWN